jgi:phosphoribosylaminoimidazole-succinocarboxamide synthase
MTAPTKAGKAAAKSAAKDKGRAKTPTKKPAASKPAAKSPSGAKPARVGAAKGGAQKAASAKKGASTRSAKPPRPAKPARPAASSKSAKGRPAPAAARPGGKKSAPGATKATPKPKGAKAPAPTRSAVKTATPKPGARKETPPKAEAARKPTDAKASKAPPPRSKDGPAPTATRGEAAAKGRPAAATRAPTVTKAKAKGAVEAKGGEKGKTPPPAPKAAEPAAKKPAGKPESAAPPAKPAPPAAADGAKPRPMAPGMRMVEEGPPPKRYPPPPPPRKLDLSRPKAVPEPPQKTDLPYPVLRRGKVREVYQLDRSELLMVTSDRVSAFDVVMKETIPRKGEVLTMLSAWWLARLETKGVEHHLISVIPEQIIEMHPDLAKTRKQWERRAMLVRKTEPIPVECVVRGYLAGSAWKDYEETHLLAGERLPDEMQEGQRLPRPMWAPATKAISGHDENVTPLEVRMALGEQLATRLERLALRIYDHGRRAAEGTGIILADTKYEFGMDYDSRLLLIDEVMTPDSSRFWPKQSYAPGKTQPSLDKQPIRDWLESEPGWDKKPPPPKLPPAVVAATTERYLEIFRRLTGTTLDDFQPPLLRGTVS